MLDIRQGSIHLFRVRGIDLYLHWSWFLIAIYEIQSRRGRYSSVLWNILEYVVLFAIVLLHEFGHALACRQTGGTVDRIMLWPLGGVAYVNPPQRPGAMLWSISAGPLVNVALLPVFYGLFFFARQHGWAYSVPDVYRFLSALLTIDLVLLVFNMLPVYPLDGGQVLRSLLWFVMGRGRSLMVVTLIGFVGIAGIIVLAVWTRSFFTAAIALFMLMNCWSGLQHSRALLQMAKIPRRPGFACPSCRTAPPLGPYWQCAQCSQSFDTFETRSVCPHCGAQYSTTVCLDCRQSRPMSDWVVDSGAASGSTMHGTVASLSSTK
jgi:Zn-dependent protease